MTLTALITTNAVLAATLVYALVHFLTHGVHADRDTARPAWPNCRRSRCTSATASPPSAGAARPARPCKVAAGHAHSRHRG